MTVMKFIMVILIGYLLGSIPFGLIFSRLSGKGDVRKWGSGRTGATNVLRTAGLKAGLGVAFCDIAKGVLAVFFAGLIITNEAGLIGNSQLSLMLSGQAAAGLAAIAGHNWPVFVKFHGGRGMATFMGGLLALCPIAFLFAGELFIIFAGYTRFVSLGTIVASVGAVMILIPLTLLSGFPIEYLLYALVGSLTIVIMHKDNIRRLLDGNERRLGEKVKQMSSAERVN